MVDQLAASALAAYGHPLVKTPNIDSIVKRGAVFDNFYSNFPALRSGAPGADDWKTLLQYPGLGQCRANPG